MENYLNSLVGKTALITGASSGIGYKTACFLADQGCNVVAIARRENKLQELQNKYPKLISYIVGDINNSELVDSIDFNIDILINNAGLALGKDLFSDSNDSDNELVIQTNITSAFKFARKSLTHMLKKQSGDIVNICSIASHEAYKYGVVYAATKHAMLAMNKALREETHGQNIRVIAVSPGMVNTEFSNVRFRGDSDKARDTYSGFQSLNATDIAFQITQALRCPRHVNLDEIIILATDQAGATKVMRK